MNLTADHAVDEDLTGERLVFAHTHTRHGERSPVNKGSSDQQNLRQHEHDQENGDHRAASQALTDTGNNRLGREIADQKAADGKNRAGGDDRRESKVERLDDCLPAGHARLQLPMTMA